MAVVLNYLEDVLQHAVEEENFPLASTEGSSGFQSFEMLKKSSVSSTRSKYLCGGNNLKENSEIF